MSRETPRNLAASVRKRPFNRAQERHEDFGLVLTKYGLERFLYRLAHSQYRDQFVLKGALLFELCTHHPYRPTRDLDLEGRGDNSINRIKQVFAEILLGNHQYCYPLTVTDHASRYLLTCEALSSTRENYAFTVFERLFKERGLPANIRSDNGVPFASAHALFNLSKLAVWWLRLGIGIERIKPGHPQQNGRHQRMHLTRKKEATKPAVRNFLQQQARFDKFIEVFNNERPHEALDMKCPAEVYQPSTRPYTGLPDIDYPLHDKTIVVTRCGRICLGRKKINFSQVFAGQAVGIKEVHDDIWLVSFMDYDLGYFDLETRVLEPLENPFGPKVLPMS